MRKFIFLIMINFSFSLKISAEENTILIQSLESDSFKIEIKGNPKILRCNEKYYIKVIDKRKIQDIYFLSTNNGQVSKKNRWNEYILIPKNKGELELIILTDEGGGIRKPPRLKVKLMVNK